MSKPNYNLLPDGMQVVRSVGPSGAYNIIARDGERIIYKANAGMLWASKSYAIPSIVLDEAERTGCHTLLLRDKNSGWLLETSINAFSEFGKAVNRGIGTQIELHRSHFKRVGELPAPKPESAQLPLVLGVGR